MGHTRFWANETNFASFMPQSHAAAPKTGNGRNERTFATKSPANAALYGLDSWR